MKLIEKEKEDIMGIQQNQMNTKSHGNGTDGYEQQLFKKRKASLLLCLTVLEILNVLLIALQQDVKFVQICKLILDLGVFLVAMRGTWKAGLLLWLFIVPSSMLYIISIQELLQLISLNEPLLSVRIILALFGSVVSIFTVIWLTLVPKNRRYSEWQ